MHGSCRVRQLVIEILVDVSRGMREIVLEVVLVHVVVVDEHASVLPLRLEVEAHVVPMVWLQLVIRVHRVLEVLGDGQGQVPGFEHSHIALEVLIVTSVVECVAIDDTNATSSQRLVGVGERLAETESTDQLSVVHFIL